VALGAGVVGKELNAGKIGITAVGTNALAFVGAGTSSLDRKAYFFAEGGTTFNGPVNIGGALQVAGQSGSDGQVLVSQGTGGCACMAKCSTYRGHEVFCLFCTTCQHHV